MQTNPNSRYKVRPGRVITDTNRVALLWLWEAGKGLLLGCGFTRVAEEDEQVEAAVRKGAALPDWVRHVAACCTSLSSPTTALLWKQRQRFTAKIQTPSKNFQGHFQAFSRTFLEMKSKQTKKIVSIHHHLLLLLIISCYIYLQSLARTKLTKIKTIPTAWCCHCLIQKYFCSFYFILINVFFNLIILHFSPFWRWI